MRRLYWRIYLSFLGVVVLFVALIALFAIILAPHRDNDSFIEAVAATVADVLPPIAQGKQPEPRALSRSLRRLSRRFGAFASLYSPDGVLLARAGEPLPRPPDSGESGWVRGRGGRAFALALPDGRWLVVRRHRHPERGAPPFVRRNWPWILVALALAVGLGAHPLARRITRRLERLQLRVDQLGGGDLAARVVVEGRDEVADLARSFNRSAQRIERLMQAQRSTMASASHELRSPLARIRMAIELLHDSARPELKAQIVSDIEELDALIEELLLASRLRSGAPVEYDTDVNLGDIVMQEAKRIGAHCEAQDVSVRGSERLLRRMLRNLLENAKRHGGGKEMSARLTRRGDGGVVITVEDRGPGVPEHLRERIFEPFYRPPGMREGEEQGVGLGLALVREIAGHHGGSVAYEPRAGGGSRFLVTLAASVTS